MPSDAVPTVNEKFACFKLKVKASKIHRWGLYAGEPIPKGRKIIEYTGERISRRETKKRANERELNYLFTLDSYWTIDAGPNVHVICSAQDAPEVEARLCELSAVQWTIANGPGAEARLVG